MNPADNVTLVPYRDDLLQVAAERVLERCATTLPDCTGLVVLLPDLQFASRLRWHLLHAAGTRNHTALLGPEISTLENWLGDHIVVSGEIPGRARCELMLVEALQQHQGVFGGIDPWSVAGDLIALFDELTRNNIDLPEELEAFTRQLQEAYGITTGIPQPLGMEAAIVHRLWQAWHTQLAAEDLLDPGVAWLQRLAMARSGSGGPFFLLAGCCSFSGAETDWLAGLLRDDRAELIIHAQAPASDDLVEAPVARLLKALDAAPDLPEKPAAFTRCLAAVFDTGGTPPAQRARALHREITESPLTGHLDILPANSAEQEAQAIDIQVRQWLLQGRQGIAVVTENRRLARRVRALLERAGIRLQDSGGWALSTTSAAAALEAWLETVEEDFAYQPLLDVLKSPFLFPERERDAHLALVYRFEQDIVIHENVARDLQRYQRHIRYRAERLPEAWNQDTAARLATLLNHLDQAADPLRECLARTPASPLDLLEGLRESLQALGMWAAFDADPAGRRILLEWQLLWQAAGHCELVMDWPEFRAWFGAALERHDFHPPTGDSPVRLLTLQQAAPGHYDALVIGACGRDHLPGTAAGSAFFNDGVRGEFDLPTREQYYQQQLYRFRCLLESAPRVLLTWCHEEAGETRLPSPWLEALQTFHQLAWGNALIAGELQALLGSRAAQVDGDNPLPVPAPGSHPAPVLAPELQPAALSASAHQSLIDCPYRFYAAHGLSLKPREAISEALEKSDYGERIHQCLEAFHGGCGSLPGPFPGPVSLASRGDAIALLETISQAVFARDLEDNFEHRAWLRRWEALIPDYIDWQIQHQQQWNVSQVEQRAEIPLGKDQILRGRLDRIDSGTDGTGIIDYKTGRVPKQDEVDTGEAVQLPTYALLTDPAPVRVEYLQLDQRISNRVALEGDRLHQLAGAVRERLLTVLDAVYQGTPLPAWGDAGVCRYCEMDGLCRRQTWLEEPRVESATGPDR